jgi:RNA polymerase sigma-70 factor, ECF subfamily
MHDLESLYRAKFHTFLSTVTALLGDVEVARDVVQDAFARSLQRLDQYEGTGSLEAWVWRIVVNRALDEARRGKTADSVRVASSASDTTNGRGGEHAHVRALISALPIRQRIAVFLRYYADLDYDDIARALDISPGTVGATLSHARATLANNLEAERR